jgi:hypothetical protein
MMERGEQLMKFPLPTPDAASIASAMRGAMWVLILVAGVWLVSGFLQRWLRAEDIGTPAEAKRSGEASAADS